MLGALILLVAALFCRVVANELVRVHIVNTGIWGGPVGLPSYGDMLGLTQVAVRETGAWLFILMCLFWAGIGAILAYHSSKKRA